MVEFGFGVVAGILLALIIIASLKVIGDVSEDNERGK